MSEKKLFVRRASGLTRIIGPFAAMVFGVHCISLSSSGLIPYAWCPWLWPGADLVALLTFSMLLCLLHATTYAQIGSIYPRSGADYILGSRIINPILQFGASFSFTVFTCLTAGSLIAWIPSSVLPSFLDTWAVLFNAPHLFAVSKWVASPTGVLVIGLLFVFVTWIACILPTKWVVRLLIFGFWLGTLAWILVYVAYLMCPGPEAFKAAYDKFTIAAGGVPYDEVIPTAEKYGFKYPIYPWWFGALAGAIMGFWIYYGYYIPNFFAGELKEAPKTLLLGSWGALIYTWAIFTIGAVLLYPRLMPLKWMAASGYLYYNTPEWSLPFTTYWASILWPHPVPVAIIMIGWVYTLVNLAMTYFFYNSRIFFAMAFDRALPEMFADVHPRLRSPVKAMTLCAILAAVGVALSVYTVIFVQFNFVLYVCLVQLIPVTAAIIYPFVRKEEFERAPKLVNFKIGPIPGITLIGCGTLAFLLWMIIACWLYPAVGGVIGPWTIGWFVAFFVGGVILFLIMRWYRMRTEGFDLLLTYKEIPPL